MEDIKKLVHIFGEKVIAISTSLGEMTILLFQILSWISRGVIDPRNTIQQMTEIGVRSFPVIGLTSIFTGMVLALQTAASSSSIFNEPLYIGTIVGYSLVKELGPVLTAIVVSGRVGAAIAAELGTMKVTEQLDALYTLGTNPVRYLAVPRFLACMLTVPILTILANVIGIVGGLLITVYQYHVPSSVYLNDIFDYMKTDSLFHGLIKSFFFAGIIVIVSCFKGFNCEGGAEGVGKATTSAVMISMVSILISDYFLSAILVAFDIG
ncbi:MAG: ABC transporter permease [Elusimicrobia bacterium]|nr:ABC transporter permease [Elusimicrobiota bacterium]